MARKKKENSENENDFEEYLKSRRKNSKKTSKDFSDYEEFEYDEDFVEDEQEELKELAESRARYLAEFGDDEEDDFDFAGRIPFSGDSCPALAAMLALTHLPRPFGICWHDDLIEKFLKARGYIFITKHSKKNPEETFKVVIKKDDDSIPEVDSSNVLEEFEREIQVILTDWLIKIGNNNE